MTREKPVAQTSAALGQLLAEANISIQKRFERHLDEIEELHQNGVKHKQILDTLNGSGFTLSMASYKDMLKRARRRWGTVTTAVAASSKTRAKPSLVQAPVPIPAMPPPAKQLDHNLKELPDW